MLVLYEAVYRAETCSCLAVLSKIIVVFRLTQSLYWTIEHGGMTVITVIQLTNRTG
jgi:hypothetical protein